jgi:hypothetical protein
MGSDSDCSGILIESSAKDIDTNMADWKVIAPISGNIETISGPAAQDRPGAHEWAVWKGQAANKAEALQRAEGADSRVDLVWMRIRYESDLDIR